MKRTFPNNIIPSNVFIFTSNRYDFSLKQFSFSRIISVRQVHGEDIVLIDKENKNGADCQADAIITQMSEVALLIRTADCLPIFIYDLQGASIGLVHAGWRGTQKKIGIKTIQLMQKKWKIDISNIRIILGPAIRRCCYVVGKEFKSFFPQTCFMQNGKYFFDLILENKNQLMGLGILEKNIFDSHICTCCNEKYFSYRREGNKAGRNVSVIMKEGGEV